MMRSFDTYARSPDVEGFVQFAQSHGLIIRYIERNRWVRVPTEDHPRKRNGAYFFADVYGIVQNWATMEHAEVWTAGKDVDADQRAVIATAMAEARREQQKTREQLAKDAAARAVTIDNACVVEEHAYLDAHGLGKVKGLVWYPEPEKNLLCVPMWRNGDMCGAQLIAVDGEKRFLFGQRCVGAEHRIGRGGTDIWCEGYCTGLAIHEVAKAMKIRCTVHVCFSAGQMTNIAKAAGCGLVIADNDASEIGLKAAQATGLVWWMPGDVGQDFCDWWNEVKSITAGMLLRSMVQKARNGVRSEPGARETNSARE